MMDPQKSLQQWALHLAGQGWPVFPLVPVSKRPAVREWETRASNDVDRIARCWSAGRYNIGVATGPAGLVVFDLDVAEHAADDPDGVDQLAALAAERCAELPGTYTVTTPSGGWHLYYTVPAGVRLRNTAGHLASRIDTRAHGGYVVAPGSVLAHGGYELYDDNPPAELPAWLVQSLAERPAASLSAPLEIAPQHRSTYAASALDGECHRVRNAAPHQHNTVLSTAAFNLGQLLPAGLLDERTARTALQQAAEPLIAGECDCTDREVARVIHAGLVAGARKPRTITTRQEAA